MQSKQIRYYICLFLCLVIGTTLLTGCGSSKKEALTQYSQSVQPILDELKKESEKWDHLRAQSRDGEISDFQFGSAVKNELLPTMQNLQERMEKIEPSKELRNIHETGIKMISKNAQALNEVMVAIYTNDLSKLTSANNLLTESRELERQYANQLNDFIK